MDHCMNSSIPSAAPHTRGEREVVGGGGQGGEKEGPPPPAKVMWKGGGEEEGEGRRSERAEREWSSEY